MTDDYTPTKDRIVSWLMEGAYTGPGADHRAEAFDTWLAEHDAKVRAEGREKADRELSADTGCPHEACEIDTAGNPTRCADCGNYLDSVPDREPSDAAVEAAARAMAHADVTNPDGWVMTEEARNVYSDMARAALIAAQEVRNRG